MSVASETLAPVCVTASKSGAAAPLISSGMLCSSPAPSAVVKKREVFITSIQATACRSLPQQGASRRFPFILFKGGLLRATAYARNAEARLVAIAYLGKKLSSGSDRVP